MSSHGLFNVKAEYKYASVDKDFFSLQDQQLHQAVH